MKQKNYIKPMVNVREFKMNLLNTVGGSDMPWGAKQNHFDDFSSSTFQESVEELDKMFE